MQIMSNSDLKISKFENQGGISIKSENHPSITNSVNLKEKNADNKLVDIDEQKKDEIVRQSSHFSLKDFISSKKGKIILAIVAVIIVSIIVIAIVLSTKTSSDNDNDDNNNTILTNTEEIITTEIIIKEICNYTELNEIIIESSEYLSSLNELEYPYSTLDNFKDALNYGNSLLNKEICSQDEIDNAKEKLSTSFTNLKSKKGINYKIPLIDNSFDINRGFYHPGGLYKNEDFERVKKQLAEGNELVTAAYNVLKTAEFAQPNAATYPTEKIVRESNGGNYINACRGASIAFQNALRWKIEGNEECAKHAVDVLMSWAKTTKMVTGDSNYPLATGLYGYQFAQAAELMRDYEGWNKEDFDYFKNWMLTVWYPLCLRFLRFRNGTWQNVGKWWRAPGHYWSNWGLCNVLAVISIGILCDDVFIYNEGISFFKYDQEGTFEDPRTVEVIKNDGLTEFLGNLVVTTTISELETGAYHKLGQMNESGRDIGHDLMSAGLTIDLAHQGYQQGDDLFAYMDHRVAAGIEYVAAQTQDIDNLPWTNYQYGDSRFYYTDSRAYIMTAPCKGTGYRPIWGTVIGHYEGIKGVIMPFTRMIYNETGIDGGASGPTSGYYDHLGYSVLLNTRDGVAPENKIPTELKGKILYSGDLSALVPSIDVEKKLGNVNENIISHTELGGLINTFVINNNVGVPKGETLILIPELPDEETDTNLWEWNTGETTRNLTIIADKSFAYRVIYTNQNGIKSEQLFTIAVQEDCLPTSADQYIYFNDTVIGNNTANVNSGDTLTLELKVHDDYGNILWSTGDTKYTVSIPCIYTSRNITAIYTSHCGRNNIFVFNLYIDTI